MLTSGGHCHEELLTHEAVNHSSLSTTRYLQHIWPRFTDVNNQIVEMDERLLHEALAALVPSQSFAHLGLIGLSGHLIRHRQQQWGEG